MVSHLLEDYLEIWGISLDSYFIILQAFEIQTHMPVSFSYVAFLYYESVFGNGANKILIICCGCLSSRMFHASVCVRPLA